MSTEDRGTETAHIAFFSIPAHGHVNPGLGLINELTRRGHRVTYATTTEFADQVREAGATPVLYETTLPTPTRPGRDWPEDLPSIRDLFREEMITAVSQVGDAYDRNRPDVIVYDIGGFHAPVLARKWGVPYIQLSPTHVAFEGVEEEFGMVPTPELEATHARYDRYFAEQGLDLTFETMTAPPRCIVTIPRSFQFRGDMVADSYTFVGPMLTDRQFQGDWQAPDDRPVLLISLGSTFTDQLDFYRRCMDAFADLDWHVVMSIGRRVQPEDLGPAPANFEVHQWIPQLRILSRADVFITHAGMGGVTEGLYHGVPLIAAPQAAEQFMNAARIEELGLGHQIDTDSVTAGEMRELARKSSHDATLRDNLNAMRREIRESGGVRRAAEIVEEHLS